MEPSIYLVTGQAAAITRRTVANDDNSKTDRKNVNDNGNDGDNDGDNHNDSDNNTGTSMIIMTMMISRKITNAKNQHAG